MNASSRYADDMGGATIECGCNSETIRSVHAYLKEHFPQYRLRDFHSPTRLMHAGLPTPHAEHHVVGLLREDTLPYHAVLLREFQEEPPDDVCTQLKEWNLADTLRAHRIAVVAKDGVSPL